jgi:hypothetical protein
MSRSYPTLVAVLAVTGLISGFVCTIFFKDHTLGVGPALGITLSISLWTYDDQRSLLKIAAFICANTLAFIAGTYTTFAVYGAQGDILRVSLLAYFAGGYVGALIVLGAGTLLFTPRALESKSVAMVLLMSIAGGLLCAFAGPLADGNLLYPVWQTGVAASLGLSLWYMRRSSSNRLEPVVAGPRS